MLPTELFEKRRQNLSHAIDRWVATGQFKNGKAVCEHHDLDIPLITQLLNSHRQIGEKFARELEQQLGLVKGSLDGEVKFVESIELMMAAMPVFRMQVHESEAFTLISIENDHNALLAGLFQLNPQLYAIEVTDSFYAPILQPDWIVVCDKHTAETGQIVCVYLANAINLILKLKQQSQSQMTFERLNGLRQVTFNVADIERVDPIVAILPVVSTF